MAGSRTFSGKYLQNKILADENEATFSNSISFDAPINKSGITCTGGDITITNTRGYCDSFYLDIYINGQYACATKEKNDKSETTHDMTLYIDTNDRIDEDVLFNSSGNIKIVAKNNNGSGNVIGLRGDTNGESKITVRAYYEDPITINPPSSLKINNTSSYTGSTAPLKWSAGSLSNGGSVSYKIYKNNSDTGLTSSTNSLTIPESTTKNWGTSAVTLAVAATGSGLTSTKSNSVTYTYKPSITTPSNLTVNGVSSYVGQSAKLSWGASTLGNGGAVTYSIKRNNSVIKSGISGTTYTFEESETYQWGTQASTFSVIATGSTATSGNSNTVTYTYKPVFTTDPSNLTINEGTSYTGQTVHLSWSPAIISNKVRPITYSIRKDGTEITTVTDATSCEFAESVASEWLGSTVSFNVVAISDNVTSNPTNSVSFTYKLPYTDAGAPENLNIDGSTTIYIKKGEAINLMWDAAQDGVDNPVLGYNVYQNETSILNNITDTEVSISTTNLTSGRAYTYKVQTVAAYGEQLSSNEVKVYLYTDPTAPTEFAISPKNPKPGSSVLFEWYGGAAGDYNNITGYDIYCAHDTNIDENYQVVEKVVTEDILGEYYLVIPDNASGTYYYKIATVGSRSSSPLSDVYVSFSISLPTKCQAPNVFSLEKEITNGQATKLFWGGAQNGTNNEIQSYVIERASSFDNVSWYGFEYFTEVSKDVLSLEVTPPDIDGHFYKYRIQVRGTQQDQQYYSEWKESDRVLQRYDTYHTQFTDPEIIPGFTRVKAIHMNELQEEINKIRLVSGKENYNFTNIKSEETSLGGWTSHIEEMRSAIDEILPNGTTVNWEVIEKNSPKASVIMQIRQVIKEVL